MKQKMCYRIMTSTILALAIATTPPASAAGWVGTVFSAVAKVFKKAPVKKVPVKKVPSPQVKPNLPSSTGNNLSGAKLLGSAVIVSVAGSVAQEATARAFEFKYNDKGAIFQEQDEEIFLGKKCNAYSAAYGEGGWGWDKDGWIVVMENDIKRTTFKYKSDNLPRFSQQILQDCELKEEDKNDR